MSVTSTWDFRRSTNLARVIARAVGQDGPAYRTALYAPDERSYGLCRMYETLSDMRESIVVRVFQDPGTALEWLGRA